ncbi:MAG: S49 family peptidase, partial [Hyphomicrobium sp.]
KPIIGHALTMCASGGMLATAAASETYAQEGALIGSIGVAGPTLISYKGVTDIDGGLLGGGVGAKEIVAQVLTAGKGKAFGNPYDVPDPSVVAHFKQMLDREYTRFKEVVSAGRGITMDKLNEIGAMIFDPTEAQELKLIDGIADEEQIRDIIAAKLGVDRDKCSFVRVRTSGGTSAALSTAQTFVADAVGYDAHASLAKALRVSPVNLVYERWF